MRRAYANLTDRRVACWIHLVGSCCSTHVGEEGCQLQIGLSHLVRWRRGVREGQVVERAVGIVNLSCTTFVAHQGLKSNRIQTNRASSITTRLLLT